MLVDADIRTFPSEDESFAQRVRDVFRACRREYDEELALLAAVALRLRDAYPAVAIQRRDPAAALDPNGLSTWYVFRDGRL